MATKPKKKAGKKSPAKAKVKAKKKLDGKALAANRKRRDSVAQFIKDELTAGKTDVNKILDRAKTDFPKVKPTRGYVRWIAKTLGVLDQLGPSRAKAAPPKVTGVKAKPKAKPDDSPGATDLAS